jgi:hypothetical protein
MYQTDLEAQQARLLNRARRDWASSKGQGLFFLAAGTVISYATGGFLSGCLVLMFAGSVYATFHSNMETHLK